MNLQTIGHLIAERRRAKGLTLTQLAAEAAVGRSTLAALEAGKLPELGLERVARLCAAVDLVLEARPLELNQPLMAHRHLSEVAGRELTKAAIDDIITRGTIGTWRKLIQAMNADKTGRIARRVTDVAQTLGKRDPKARAFAALLRKLHANRTTLLPSDQEHGNPDWETLLAHAALLQAKIPAAILVGGTAAAVHAGHRISFDHDHVVKDLAKNYDAAIRALESIAGWHTHRRVKGKMVLGNVNKIAAGLRNQRRSAPLETTEVVVQDGRRLRLPTIEETLRIKTFLVVDRNATRDYLDVAALSHHIGLTKSAAALERMNELYAEFKDEGGDLLTAVVVKLSLPDPYDLTDIDLSEYKGIVAPWNNWRAVQAQCASLAAALIAPPRV